MIEEIAPPIAHVDKPTPNISITVVDRNTHKLAFFFSSVGSKFALHLRENLPIVGKAIKLNHL